MGMTYSSNVRVSDIDESGYYSSTCSLTNTLVASIYRSSVTTNGIVTLGNRSGNNVTYSNTKYIFTTDSSIKYLDVFKIDDTHFTITWVDNNYRYRIKIATAIGNTITLGSEYTFYSGTPNNGVAAVLLDSTHIAFLNTLGGDIYVKVGIINGNTVSYGSTYKVYDNAYNSCRISGIVKIDSSKALILFYSTWEDLGTGDVISGVRSFILNVSGNVATIGDKYYISDNYPYNPRHNTTLVNANKAFFVYKDYNNSYYGTAQIIEFSNAGVISSGVPEVFHTYSTDPAALYLSGDFVNIFFSDTNNSYYGTSILCEINGNDISFGSLNAFYTDTGTSGFCADLYLDGKASIIWNTNTTEGARSNIGLFVEPNLVSFNGTIEINGNIDVHDKIASLRFNGSIDSAALVISNSVQLVNWQNDLNEINGQFNSNKLIGMSFEGNNEIYGDSAFNKYMNYNFESMNEVDGIYDFKQLLNFNFEGENEVDGLFTNGKEFEFNFTGENNVDSMYDFKQLLNFNFESMNEVDGIYDINKSINFNFEGNVDEISGVYDFSKLFDFNFEGENELSSIYNVNKLMDFNFEGENELLNIYNVNKLMDFNFEGENELSSIYKLNKGIDFNFEGENELSSIYKLNKGFEINFIGNNELHVISNFNNIITFNFLGEDELLGDYNFKQYINFNFEGENKVDGVYDINKGMDFNFEGVSEIEGDSYFEKYMNFTFFSEDDINGILSTTKVNRYPGKLSKSNSTISVSGINSSKALIESIKSSKINTEDKSVSSIL